MQSMCDHQRSVFPLHEQVKGFCLGAGCAELVSVSNAMVCGWTTAQAEWH
jgi:hypothetical protein